MEGFFKSMVIVLVLTVSLICLTLNATSKEIQYLEQRIEVLEKSTQGGIQ